MRRKAIKAAGVVALLLLLCLVILRPSGDAHLRPSEPDQVALRAPRLPASARKGAGSPGESKDRGRVPVFLTKHEDSEFFPSVPEKDRRQADLDHARKQPLAVRAAVRQIGLPSDKADQIIAWEDQFESQVRQLLPLFYEPETHQTVRKEIARLRKDLDEREVRLLGQKSFADYDRAVADNYNSMK
jgi:hypothetical protein